MTKENNPALKKNKEKSGLNLPTILTVFRIFLIIPLLILIFIDSVPAKIIAIICFALASATDFIDGKLARSRGEVTELGKFLDPLADKMLVNLTFLALVVLDQVPVFIFGTILVRDFMVDGLRMMAAKKNITIAASKFGKLKTAAQMITIISILVNMIVINDIWQVVNNMLLYVVLLLTVFSGADYLIKGHKLVI